MGHCREPPSGLPVHSPPPEEDPGLHRRRPPDSGPRHRGQLGHLQSGERDPPHSPSLRGVGPTGGDLVLLPGVRRIGSRSVCRGPLSHCRRRPGLRSVGDVGHGHVHHHRPRRAGGGALCPGDRRHLRGSPGPTFPGPTLHPRGPDAGHPPDGHPQPRLLGETVRGRPRRLGPDPDHRRVCAGGHWRHAPGLPDPRLRSGHLHPSPLRPESALRGSVRLPSGGSPEARSNHRGGQRRRGPGASPGNRTVPRGCDRRGSGGVPGRPRPPGPEGRRRGQCGGGPLGLSGHGGHRPAHRLRQRGESLPGPGRGTGAGDGRAESIGGR